MSEDIVDVSIAPYALYKSDGQLLTYAALNLREFLAPEPGPAGDSGSPDEQADEADAGGCVEAAVTLERVDGVPAPVPAALATRHGTVPPAQVVTKE